MGKIAIVGHFGGKNKFNDGQTIKTVTLYENLKGMSTYKIDKIDTYYVYRRPLYFIFMFLKSIFTHRKYIVLLSENGRRILFPVFSFMGKYLKKEIYHYAIGGRLAKEIREGRISKKSVNNFQSNWVESKKLVKNLHSLGIANAAYIPNFKNIPILSSDSLLQEFYKPYPLCMFSRVIKEKGIEDAIDAVQRINKEAGECIVKLDIYGPVESDYEEGFYKLVSMYDEVKYCGIVPAEQSVEVLKNYYALLFPSYWPGEGMPGTIIDAFAAGLPVIARRWEYCDEMIENGVNGYVYDFDKPEVLKEVIMYAVSHRENTVQMKQGCLKKAVEYEKEHVMHMILKEMGI